MQIGRRKRRLAPAPDLFSGVLLREWAIHHEQARVAAASIAAAGCSTYPNQYGYDPYGYNNGYYGNGYYGSPYYNNGYNSGYYGSSRTGNAVAGAAIGAAGGAIAGAVLPGIRQGTGAIQPNQPSASGGNAAHINTLPAKAMANVERHQAGSVIAAELIDCLAPLRWRGIVRRRYASCERRRGHRSATIACPMYRPTASTTRPAAGLAAPLGI